MPDSAAALRLAICTDTYPPQVNGVARTLERLAGAVEARGGTTHIITVADPDAEPGEGVTRIPAVPFWAYPQLRMAAPAVGKVRRALTAFRPTLVHAATPFGVGLAARAASLSVGVPLVTSYHTHFTAYLRHYNLRALNVFSWPFLRWFHNSGLRTYAPSETVRRELEAQRFTNTRVWSRGVDAERFHPRHRSDELRASLGVRDGGALVLYVGRLAPEKGISNALEGVALAMRALPGRITFVLTGDGPWDAHARELAPPGTVFTGALKGQALSEMYASADIFVFPSLTETFGNVVLEAMASGLALVAPNRGPTTELANESRALACDVANPRAIAECVSKLASDPAQRASLAAKARCEAEKRTWEAIFDELIGDYLEVQKTQRSEN